MSGPADDLRPGWPAPRRVRRLLLATPLDHVLPMVARSATALGLNAETTPGLLDVVEDSRPLDGRRFDQLFARLARELTSAETDAVRVALDPDSDDGAVLAAQLLAAPTLSVELARRGVTVEVGLLTEAALWPVYQPVVDLADGRVVGHEALLRGRVDGREVGGGDLFFLAAAAGWTDRLDRLAREAAIRGAAGWLGAADLYVNSSPEAVFRPQVCLEGTEAAVHDAGLRPDQVVVEVVEAHAARDRGHLLAVLEHQRSLGWRVALDDVGVGWSSLALVSALRPDVVKLDKALVARLDDVAAQAVVGALVELAHSLDAVVVAEGVEHEQRADQVRDLGVDLGQGWLFGRPVRPAVAVPEELAVP
ncbi:MAG: Diguanylate phosphodiesterase [Klenkia sp.]|nr:Diguanylate phosphodiesterase [Klenkia sp.]